MSQTSLTIAGLGGQGSILAGIVLGAAAVRYDGKYATQTQAYSSELRGGFAAAWVIVSDAPVEFPRVIAPDILVAQAPDSVERFLPALKPGGVLIYDSDMIKVVPREAGRNFSVPATSAARYRLKAPVTANMVVLGALCRVSGVVSRPALEKAIAESVPAGKDRLNLKAFDLGFQQVSEVV